jgi:hypothetical protein
MIVWLHENIFWKFFPFSKYFKDFMLKLKDANGKKFYQKYIFVVPSYGGLPLEIQTA